MKVLKYAGLALFGFLLLLSTIPFYFPARDFSYRIASFLEYARGQAAAYDNPEVSIRFENTACAVYFLVSTAISVCLLLLIRKGKILPGMLIVAFLLLLNVPYGLLEQGIGVSYPIGSSEGSPAPTFFIAILVASAIFCLLLYLLRHALTGMRKIWLVLCTGLLLFSNIALVVPQRSWKSDLTKQDETAFTDMYLLRKALQSYYVDHKQYPSVRSMPELAAALKPYWKKELLLSGREADYKNVPVQLPTKDAWGNELRYQAWPEKQPQDFILASAGGDGKWEHENLRDYQEGYALEDSDRDIVLGSAGTFIQWPGGILD